MMPCQLCGEHLPARGLKQVGKTATKGIYFVRRYRCQDCDAIILMYGNLREEESVGQVLFPPGTVILPPRGIDRFSHFARVIGFAPETDRP
jgi:hypothetical protein